MNSILSFIKGLQHKFSKNEIAKSCELTLTSLREHTLPAFASAVQLEKSIRMSSPEARGLMADFRSAVGAGDFLATIEKALTNAQSLLMAIDKKSETLFGDQEASMALTYQKATYLQVLAAINFANDYSRKLLNYLYIAETAKADPEVQLTSQLSRAEIEFVESYFNTFCGCVRFMLNDFSNLEKGLDDMPEAVVTELTEQTLPVTMGASKIDPAGLRGLSLPIDINVRWTPFYLIGTMIASFQVACYNASREELDLLQMRKLNLEKIHAKKPDARLQKEIDHLAERVTRLNYEIQKAQEKYGVQ